MSTIIKPFRKGVSLNEVYAEMNKQKAFIERYEKRMMEAAERGEKDVDAFQKLVEARDRHAYAEDLIRKLKRHHNSRPWEEQNGGQNRK